MGKSLRVGLALSLTLAIHSYPVVALAQDENREPDTTGRYLILDTVRVSTMRKELSAAAAAGFRVVTGDSGNNTLLLEKDPEGKKHEYLFTDSLPHSVEKGELKGYRVLAETFGIGSSGPTRAVFEKLAEGEPQSEYHVLHTLYTSNFEKDLNAWAAKGFRLLALSGSSGNDGLMERASGSPASGPADRYVLLATSKTGTMEKELAQTVARGYRVVAATGAHKEMLVALEKTAPSDAGPEYRLLSATQSGTLEKEIVEASGEGYRLLPSTLCALEKSAGMFGTWAYEIATIMEKIPGGQVPRYKLLATRRVPTLQKELTEAAAGWTVSRLFLSYEEQIIVLEKASE